MGPRGKTRKKREGRQEGAKKKKENRFSEGSEVEGGAHGKRQKVRRTREEFECENERKKREAQSRAEQERKAQCKRSKKDRSGEGHERNTLMRKEKEKPSN